MVHFNRKTLKHLQGSKKSPPLNGWFERGLDKTGLVFLPCWRQKKKLKASDLQFPETVSFKFKPPDFSNVQSGYFLQGLHIFLGAPEVDNTDNKIKYAANYCCQAAVNINDERSDR